MFRGDKSYGVMKLGLRQALTARFLLLDDQVKKLDHTCLVERIQCQSG